MTADAKYQYLAGAWPSTEARFFEEADVAESELPAGKTVWIFEKTDMKAAKEKFGSFACIGGNVPAPLFSIDTAQMMEEYCKKLLDIAAPAGGFFLSPGAIIDQAKPENIRAYLDSARKFGGYHT